MGRVVHFEIHAGDPAKAIEFYSALFGWKFENWGNMEYWQIETGNAKEPGINGGLLPRRVAAPQPGQAVNAFVCTVQVDSLDAAFTKALALGATVAMAKSPIPGIGWLAYIKDLDGNLVGMLQPDPAAR